jgi:hypothetical protein
MTMPTGYTAVHEYSASTLKRDSAAMIMQLRLEIARSICRADGRS